MLIYFEKSSFDPYRSISLHLLNWNWKKTNLIKSLVEIEFLTAEPNFDEIMVSYCEYTTGSYTLNPYTFS